MWKIITARLEKFIFSTYAWICSANNTQDKDVFRFFLPNNSFLPSVLYGIISSNCFFCVPRRHTNDSLLHFKFSVSAFVSCKQMANISHCRLYIRKFKSHYGDIRRCKEANFPNHLFKFSFSAIFELILSIFCLCVKSTEK